MKRFSFPLDRVLEWRQTRLDVAEGQLGRLESEHTAVMQELIRLNEDVAAAGDQILRSDLPDGAQLKALSSYRHNALAQGEKLAGKQSEIERKIEQQRSLLVELRRGCRLLETLREKRLAEWQGDLDRDQEHLSADSHRALRHRADRQEESS